MSIEDKQNPNSDQDTKTSDNEDYLLKFEELTISIRSESSITPPVEIITFDGHITNSNSHDLNRKFYRIFEKNNYRMILDLSALDYANSSGIAILFSIFYRVKENNGRIVIGGMHPFLKKVFGLMDIPSDVDIYDSPDEAGKSF